jgi:hypothetical protein
MSIRFWLKNRVRQVVSAKSTNTGFRRRRPAPHQSRPAYDMERRRIRRRPALCCGGAAAPKKGHDFPGFNYCSSSM